MSFGSVLKELREQQCTTQRELATRSGFSYEAIRSYEYNRRMPKAWSTVVLLVTALELDGDDANKLYNAVRIGGNTIDTGGLIRNIIAGKLDIKS